MNIQSAIAGYLEDLAISFTSQSLGTYHQGIKRFVEFLESKRVTLAQTAPILTVEIASDFANFLNTYKGKKGLLKTPTKHTYLASISRFYTYLLRERIIDFTASDLVRLREAFHDTRHGQARDFPKPPPENAVLALLAAARRAQPAKKFLRLDLARARNIAMLEALRSSGMRVGELVSLRREDLAHRTHTARVTGKGDKQRIVYFDDDAWRAIQEYLEARQDGATGRALHQLPLFARHDRRASKKILPLTTDAVRLVFSELARAAKLEITLTPHSLRHAFATKVLDSTGDLAVVQDMLGHASPETTRIYAQVSSKRMRDAHRAAFDYTDKKDD